ncbi:MAG TPA: hypothetical protein P5079_05510, partial [Elusimicrobiota bacterium]|nr:hypothetical protein [Elusimicrobiota bacterium]
VGGRTVEEDLRFHLGGADLIRVPVQGGGSSQFFADSNADLEFEGEGNNAILRIAWRPGDGLHYIFKAGTGDFELRIPSGPATNEIVNGPPGRIWGAEVGWTLMPDSPVTPALAVSLGYTRADYSMARLKSGSAEPVPVNQRFSLEEWQGAVCVSNRWGRVEPYGGLRMMRHRSTLKDLDAAESVSGVRVGLAPYGGVKFEIFSREALVLEVSGLDETAVTAGIAVGF